MPITQTNFKFKNQQSVYKGKVRDVYALEDKLIVVASDRISAFDHILPRAIPFKGQVLNQIAAYFLDATADIVPNWLLSVPDPNVSVGVKCEPFKVEMVIRGYLSGHAWREYKSGKRIICGVEMPDGLRESDPFPQPIITPSTKADEGHDMDISQEEIINAGIVSESDYAVLAEYTRKLYAKGSQMAREKGLILMDTKYEFGKADGKIMLIDEVHTPDSSRYIYADGYEEKQEKGIPQQQLSKEFVREWLMANGFQGKEGQSMPEMNDELVNNISERYISLYEKITGKTFIRTEQDDVIRRIEENLSAYL